MARKECPTTACQLGDPAAFVAAWEAAWNAHDVEGILAHCHEHVELRSPVAARLLFDPAGRVIGKKALRAYWDAALERTPDLKVTVTSLAVGIDMLIIHYLNRDELPVYEVFMIQDRRIATIWGCYPFR